MSRTTPAVIAVAPNGARRGPADHAALPVTAEAIAAEARRCRDAGAAMLHLHVRDAEGRHSLDPDLYRAAVAAVRAAVGDDLLIQVTTEAVGRYGPGEMMASVRSVAPEAVSIALRELLPAEGGDESAAAAFLDDLRAAGTRVQHIVYAPAELERLQDLRARGVIPGGVLEVLFVLGAYAGRPADPADLLPFLAARRDPVTVRWSVCAFGPAEAACAAAALALGGHARVGFENNLVLPDGRPAPDNAALVAAVAALARGMGRPLADGPAAREIMAVAA